MGVQEVCTDLKTELLSPELTAERRRAAWKALLLGGLDAESSEAQHIYKGLSQIPCSYDDVIRRDVGRTLPREKLFRESGGKGQSSLFRLLHALAVQHGDIGYVQSLNFVVATLINVFPDDEALVFSCAKSLLFRHTLADFYRPSFPKLGVAIWQFDRLIEGFLPKAHAALDAHGITAEFYAMQWFLTLFASDLPQNVVVQIWDRFLLVGWQIIAQVALALISKVQDELWELDECGAMTLLKKFAHTRRFQAEPLLLDAAKFDVSHRMLSDLEAAHSRGEDPGEVRLESEEDPRDGTLHWTVQRGPRRRLRRSNSNHSIGQDVSEALTFVRDCHGLKKEALTTLSGSESGPLPRAFSRSNSTASTSLGSSPRSNASLASSPRSSNASISGDEGGTAKVTLLPFIMHNLDTGETTLLEDEWTEYMEEQLVGRQSPSPESPTLSHLSWQTASPAPTTKKGGACGGSFWVQSQQMQALRTLGKA